MNYREKAFKYRPLWCGVCHIPKFLTVHHKDGNPKNNKLNNLQILCTKHHKIIHNLNPSKRRINQKYQKGTPHYKRTKWKKKKK